MLKFFKDSFREIKHVVWPTASETKKYFIIIVIVLVLFGIYVSLAGTIFSEGMFALRNLLK